MLAASAAGECARCRLYLGEEVVDHVGANVVVDLVEDAVCTGQGEQRVGRVRSGWVVVEPPGCRAVRPSDEPGGWGT